MAPKTSFKLSLAVLLLIVTTSTSIRAGLRDNNLIEFSRGSYGNMSRKAMLWPPFVKVYQDGKIIHYEGDEHPKEGARSRTFYVSQLGPTQLESLKKRLADEKYLWKSRFIDMPGDDINVHGGVSYMRYLDGDREILLATKVKPRGGPWLELTEDIWAYVPDDHEQVFYPASIGLEVWEDTSEYSEQNPPPWPFASQIKLHPKLKTISNPEIIHHLFARLNSIFSFYYWTFQQDDKRYTMALVKVPEWFEPDYLNKALAKVRKNGYRVRER